MTGAKLSVVTVCKDDLDGLRMTRASVAAQRGAVIEHVIVDGGSGDGTADYLRSLAEEPRLTFRSEPDAGIYDAMNKGWRLATGDLVLFLNSGDRFTDETVVDRICANHHDHHWLWAVGVSRMLENGRPVRLHGVVPFTPLIFTAGWKSLPHQSTVMSRELLRELGGFDVTYGMCSDQELLYRAYLRTSPATLFEFIADCDASGVSSKQPPHAFVSQMARIRRAHGQSLFGSKLADVIATVALIVARQARYKAAGRL